MSILERLLIIVGGVLTETVVLADGVGLQEPPSARTKYVVCEEGVTVNCDPSALGVPLAGCVHSEFVNHFHEAPSPRVPPVWVRV